VYEFEGTIIALGLTLPELEGGKLPTNTIRWLEAGGVERESITAWVEASKKNRFLILEALAAEASATLSLRSRQKGLGPGEEAAPAAVRAQAGAGITVTIIDEQNSSSFLRLLALGKQRINFGTSVEVGAGATVTVAHGLGVAPVNVQLTPITASANLPVIPENPTTENFKIKNTGAVGIFCFWLAIG
jgi:hypothetical protein